MNTANLIASGSKIVQAEVKSEPVIETPSFAEGSQLKSTNSKERRVEEVVEPYTRRNMNEHPQQEEIARDPAERNMSGASDPKDSNDESGKEAQRYPAARFKDRCIPCKYAHLTIYTV